MKKIALSVFFIIIFALNTGARKAVDRYIPFRQPDGTTIPVKGNGDAFFHFKSTRDGCIVVEDEQGWLCYGYITPDGKLTATQVRIGPDAPSSLISKSRSIPWDVIARKRMERRSLRPRPGIALRSPVHEGGNSGIEGERYALVILAQYKDIGFQYTQEDFIRMLTEKGYDRFGAHGCAAEYFNEQFGDKVEFHFDVSPVVTLSRNRSWYGKNIGSSTNGDDARPEEMIAEACRLADDVIDFTKYDANRDGVVDNVFLFFAGDDEAETLKGDCIWSHAYYIYSGTAHIDLMLDGVRIDRYACTSEMTYRKKTDENFVRELAGIGTFCHEFSHTFGLPDFYDTDYGGSGGEAKALWRTTALMDAGNHNNEGNTPPYYNAIEREMLGLSTPIELSESGTYTLEPIHIKGQCYRISTSNPDEYYLLECRYPERWDQYCGGRGLLIYHIDRSEREAGMSDSYNRILTARERWGNANEVNCRPDRQCAGLLAAVPESADASGVFFPQDGKDAIYGSSLKFWDGGHSGISLTGIRQEGKNIVFEAEVEEKKVFPVKLTHASYQTSAVIDFETLTDVGKAILKCSMPGDGKNFITKEVIPYAPKKFSGKLEDLNPDTQYIIQILLDDKNAGTSSLNLSTKGFSPLTYIELEGADGRYPNGIFSNGASIPLEVVCPEIPLKVNWLFDGKEIQADKDNRFHLTRSGILKAEVFFKDGRMECITKKIKVI